MTKHRAGVAQAKIYVLMTVNIGEARPFGTLDEEWRRHRPIAHPVHGHTVEQIRLGAFGKPY